MAEAYFTETKGRGTKDHYFLLLFLPPPRPSQLTVKTTKQTLASPQVTVGAARFGNGRWLGQPVTSLIRNRKLIRFPGANRFSLPLP